MPDEKRCVPGIIQLEVWLDGRDQHPIEREQQGNEKQQEGDVKHDQALAEGFTNTCFHTTASLYTRVCLLAAFFPEIEELPEDNQGQERKHEQSYCGAFAQIPRRHTQLIGERG